ncbi:cell division cycle 25 homolog d isoform X1 [Conger conger]|uniref:cell division cycle 25 homolog d isoform X1 n=1 Tax=Conger conger TaxID=82655 RepID=UPI002A598956|nr:cell division cycle 25 homolog d isoform X1 [Conger conger]
MEISQIHASPEADICSPQNISTAWSLSPDPGPSSDSELSFYLDNLHCQEGCTPRRKLLLTPELLTPSPNQNREVSQEMTTPTGSDKTTAEGEVGKRKGSGSQRGSDPKMDQNAWKVQGTSEDRDRDANKENKRLRVKLSSRFAGSTALQGLARGRGQRQSPEASRDPGKERWTELATLLPGQWAQSRHRLHPLDIPDSVDEDTNLIGDYSKPHLFPVERGEHLDLQYISAQTVASLLSENYQGVVESYLIIDCRYPYEFKGGHIKGAVNFHSEMQLQEALFQDTVIFQKSPRTMSPSSLSTAASLSDAGSPSQWGAFQEQISQGSTSESGSSPDGPSPRKLIVFHCEFSTERGPRLYRNLRKLDRSLNVYPQLFYPELYVLEGGYKEFFSQFPGLCEPSGYVPMLHRDFREQLCRFRRKRRSRAMQHRKKQLFKSGL